MGQIWITALMLFLGLNIAINIGGYEMQKYRSEYAPAYVASESLIYNVTATSTGAGKGMWEYLIAQFLTPAVLGAGLVVGILGRFLTGSGSIALLAGFSAALSSWFLNPLSAISALGLPEPIGSIIFLLMNGLLLIAIVDFVKSG